MISIDLSLRSTGIVNLDEEFNVIDCAIISNKDLQNEELIMKNSEDILHFIIQQQTEWKVVLEALSFGGVSSSKDILYGNFWYLRCKLKSNNMILVDTVPVKRWRCNLFDKTTHEAYKNEKDGVKKMCVDALPDVTKQYFLEYIDINKLKPKSIYDLADAYWLNVYQQKLEKN